MAHMAYPTGARIAAHETQSSFSLIFFRGTWTPKVCKIMAFIVIIMGLGLLFYKIWWV